MNTQKGFSNILGILLIVIVIGGGFYIYKTKLVSNNTESVSENKTNDSTSTIEVKKQIIQKEEEIKINESASGIITKVYLKDNKNYLDIDYVELNLNWKPGGMSGGVYTNTNSKIRTFEISNNAKFLIGEGEYKEVSFTEFKDVYNNPQGYQKENPWDIIVVNNSIVEIKEHFIP